MAQFQVTRAHLKKAFEQENWDLLDKLLELDATAVNDNALFTDTWGEWWGLVFEAVRSNSVTGLTILLKHGADPAVGNWGDCLVYTPLELAQEKQAADLIPLLEGTIKPVYVRQNDPTVPLLTAADQAINRQGQVLDETGLAFQVGNFTEGEAENEPE